MRKFIKTKAAVALGVVAALALAVGAYAYFTSTGTGSGSGTVGTSTAWDVTTDAATGTALTPGIDGPTQTIGYHVKNNSTGVQKLQTVTIEVANSNGTAWTSGTCSAADFEVGGAAAGTAKSYTINTSLAKDAQYDSSTTLHMVDTGANQDACKGVTVPLYVSAS
jgi:hypothetical protein